MCRLQPAFITSAAVAGCVEALAEPRALRDAFWTLHRPPQRQRPAWHYGAPNTVHLTFVFATADLNCLSSSRAICTYTSTESCIISCSAGCCTALQPRPLQLGQPRGRAAPPMPCRCCCQPRRRSRRPGCALLCSVCMARTRLWLGLQCRGITCSLGTAFTVDPQMHKQ